MSAIHILTDIDGTLGRSEREILTSLQTLRTLGPTVRVSFVTGRSLTALRPLAREIPAGTLVSPWSGGNALRRAPDGYRPAWPLTAIRATAGPGFTFIHVPRSGSFDDNGELMREDEEDAPATHVCVGAYREVTDGAPPAFGALHRGLGGTRWELVSPWERTRRELLRRMRRSGVGWIAYWGDDAVDAQAIGEADLVLAPRGSALSQHGRVAVYSSIEEALALTLRAAPQPADASEAPPPPRSWGER